MAYKETSIEQSNMKTSSRGFTKDREDKSDRSFPGHTGENQIFQNSVLDYSNGGIIEGATHFKKKKLIIPFNKAII